MIGLIGLLILVMLFLFIGPLFLALIPIFILGFVFAVIAGFILSGGVIVLIIVSAIAMLIKLLQFIF